MTVVLWIIAVLLAAIGPVALMVGAAVTHNRRGQQPMIVILLVLALAVA